jgi:predicted PurR-regulated permease PerM
MLVLAVTLTTAAFVLFEVWGVVVFAVTVAYVLAPLHQSLAARGLSKWWASAVSTLAGTLVALVPISVAAFLAYRRRESVTAFLRRLPDTVDVQVLGTVYVVDVQTLLSGVAGWLTDTALSVASGLPELGLKATLFAFVVFGLLRSHEAAEAALLAAVPTAHEDVVRALARRARRTLRAIYVLQFATGAATFAVGLGVFWALGYDIFVTLAFLAGVLQFLPIVGPSVLVVLLAGYHLVVGDVGAALAVLLVAGVFVAWLPDVVVRPRLSEQTGDLEGTLYFVGFVGGLLTVGPVGVVAGPLAVALVAEAISLVAAANHDE